MMSSSSEVDQSTDIIVDHLLKVFANQYQSNIGRLVVRAPGRVNLIGDHTDYNEGFVLPMTIDLDVYAVLRKRSDQEIHLFSVNYGESLDYLLTRRPPVRSGHWMSYVTGAVEELRRRGLLRTGLDLLIYGDVPTGAGLSSSAALEVAVVFGVNRLFDLGLGAVETALLCQTVEHRYAGVECGIMDQFASRLGRTKHALFLDCRSLEYEHVPLPLEEAGLALVIADSGVTRMLADSKYSERQKECHQIVDVMKRLDSGIMSLRDVTIDLLKQARGSLDQTLENRARHVVTENARVVNARDALLAGDFNAFGDRMNESHQSLRDLFEVSSAELDLLVETAQDCDGVLGARMTGGGFGGATINLVERDAVSGLIRALRSTYRRQVGREPRIYVLKQNHETEVLNEDP